ncbi:hypothetical protein [Enterococcus hirae]|uniref:hypothetical protein n=1 Tax=Enterococcus hirae TaxID=1354 RepID=UPI00136E5A05|nr:hypothetical protein [Enterococcus hirae]NAE18210.1 hypothetical protein [Enterococcus hirae]
MASWPDRWSEAEEELYALMDREGWAQHFHCGWDEGDTWRDPRAIGDWEGMCGKEWSERQGVAAIANMARRRP